MCRKEGTLFFENFEKFFWKSLEFQKKDVLLHPQTERGEPGPAGMPGPGRGGSPGRESGADAERRVH